MSARDGLGAVDRIAFCVGQHESGKGLLQWVGRLVLFLESLLGDRVQFQFCVPGPLEDLQGVKLRKRLRAAHFENGVLLGVFLRGGDGGKFGHIERGDIADFGVARAVDARGAIGRIEAEHGTEPHFHEIRGAKDDRFHGAGLQARFALAFRGLER